MLYSIIVSAGLETIARQELTERFGNTGALKVLEPKPQRLLFQYTGNPRDLLSLRTAEHLFLVLKRMPKMTRSRSSLAALRGSLRRFNFKEMFECWPTGRAQCSETHTLSGNESTVRETQLSEA